MVDKIVFMVKFFSKSKWFYLGRLRLNFVASSLTSNLNYGAHITSSSWSNFLSIYGISTGGLYDGFSIGVIGGVGGKGILWFYWFLFIGRDNLITLLLPDFSMDL